MVIVKSKVIGIFVLLFFYSALTTVYALSEPFSSWSSIKTLPYTYANTQLSIDSNKLFIYGATVQLGDSRSYVRSIDINNDGSLGNINSDSANMLEKSIWHSMVTKDNFVYILGGTREDSPGQPYSVGSTYFGQILNNKISSWTSGPDLNNGKRISLGTAVRVNDKIYLLGGGTWTNGGSPVVSSDIFVSIINSVDGSLSPWNYANKSMPTSLFEHGAVAIGNKIILIGGSLSSNPSSTNKVWSTTVNSDGSLNDWQAETNLPFTSRRAMVTIANGYLVHAGGVVNGSISDQVWYATIDNSGSLGSWTESTNKLPGVDCCAAITANESRLYIVGGYGSDYLNTVWSATIGPVPTPTPTPTPIPLTPIILIPGMGASWNYEALVHGTAVADTDWKIAPYVKVYDGLISALETAGYVRDSNLFVYAYDWRKNVSQTQQNLADFINQKGLAKVNLIGHSLGGLVARAYAQSNSDKVYKLLTVGSSHQGAGGAFYLWEGVDLREFPGWQKLAMKLLLRINRAQYDTEVTEVQTLFPALRNILPIYEFLRYANGTIKPLSSLTWTNNFLPLGGDLAQLRTLSGNWGNTLKFIQVGPRTAADILTGRWVDGKPSGQTENDSGDGTVLLSSSQASGAAANDELSGQNHTQIISQEISQKKILDMLGLLPSGQDINQPAYDSAIIVTTASPVNFQVSGPGGTFLPTDGIVVIDNPADGDYQVTVSPIGAGGDYTLYFGRIKGGDEAWEEVNDSVVGGQTDQPVFGVQLNQASLGDVPLDNAQARIDTLLSLKVKKAILQDLARIKSYVVDIGGPKVNTAAKFDARMGRLYRTIDALSAKKGVLPEIKEGLRLVKQDVYQYRGDKFGN